MASLFSIETFFFFFSIVEKISGFVNYIAW